MNMEITREQADDIASGVDGEVYDDYSGRYMYGATCVGFSGDFTDFALAVAMSRVLDEYELESLAEMVRSDSMGLGVVVYFPGLKLADEE